MEAVSVCEIVGYVLGKWRTRLCIILTGYTRRSFEEVTGTCSISEIRCRRLALMRFVPFSYFCNCWNVKPSASATFVWDISSIRRRMRTRFPTCLSVGCIPFFWHRVLVPLEPLRRGYTTLPCVWKGGLSWSFPLVGRETFPSEPTRQPCDRD
jgi:hypothetical protein